MIRTIHRIFAVFAVFGVLWVALTGLSMQAIDLKTLFAHAPASDPDMQAIRDGHYGPPNFQVLQVPDFTARPLPADLDLGVALGAVVKSERAVSGEAPVRFVELRMKGDKPVGQADVGGRLLAFDAVSGAVLAGPNDAPKTRLPPPPNQPSLRNTIKAIHRMTAYGDWGPWLFMALALTVCTMIFTGLWQYFQLLAVRARLGRPAPYWSAGGWWRTLHRTVAITASLFLAVIVTSGTVEAIGSIGVLTFRIAHNGRPGLTADVSKPLTDAELPAMLDTTLKAYRAANPNDPIKVLRLRYFAGMPQGIVVSAGKETEQLVFNAASGRPVSLTEPGYPLTGQPFGWQADQTFKQIHRGDMFGLPGRFIGLFTGLSVLFLAISGTVTYLDLWNRRRKAGRAGLFWT
jgi:uncharacterized iron-regulated membrane protein